MENLEKNIDLDELVDIRDVNVHTDLTKEERIEDYIKQIKNPYCYKYKNFQVNVFFNEDENAPTLEECLTKYIENL
ncbi:DUF6870 family protein [[Clostridium] colinum]|uniref:DUF6870 family protein n=1 Tax=[Clostridium] colinum TaxID=36835 RepID=UPI0020240104|nr:hypothetical protein [[Clostridium] colinum]